MNITTRQDEPEHLDRLLAYSYRYRVAARWRNLRMAGTLVLAAAVPALALTWPERADLLAAIAAFWLVLGRVALAWLERSSYVQAAVMQEYYDTQLFKLPWNTGLVGPEPNQVDIAADAAKIQKRDRYLKWYDVDLGNHTFPGDVLLCQMQSSAWSRRDHQAYSNFLISAATIWTSLGVVYGLYDHLSLADFLVRLFLPSAPALLDGVELAIAHRAHASDRRAVEDMATSAWRSYRAGTAVSGADLREIQNAAFRLRRDQPRIPNFLYKLRRKSTSAATRAAAQASQR